MTAKARRGTFQTRNGRLVRLHEQIEIEAARQPGMAPEKRKVWRGTLFNSDGKTPDSDHNWEESGAFSNQLGVAHTYDLANLVNAEDDPPPAAKPAEAPKPEPVEQPKTDEPVKTEEPVKTAA